MQRQAAERASFESQVRLMLEDLCSDLCRFGHVAGDGSGGRAVRIQREYPLGPDAFADLRVAPPGAAPYFVEVKYGYALPALLATLRRKYRVASNALADAAKVVVVVDADRFGTSRPRLEQELRQCLLPQLDLELWDEAAVRERIERHLGISLPPIAPATFSEISRGAERARGYVAFGGDRLESYSNDPLRAELLWHFGVWRLRELCREGRTPPDRVMPPGMYADVAIVMADLCGFSSYVRDTHDEEVIRNHLTAFYAKTRHEIIDAGGMLYNFVGDEVIGLFGIPEPGPAAIASALEAACGLASIGNAISTRWQRSIDRVQPTRGVHIGISLGDLQMVSLRPFSRTRIGAIGDSLNMAARLMAGAGPGEIVVSNGFHQALDDETQQRFANVEAIECKNLGRINAWRLVLECPTT